MSFIMSTTPVLVCQTVAEFRFHHREVGPHAKVIPHGGVTYGMRLHPDQIFIGDNFNLKHTREWCQELLTRIGPEHQDHPKVALLRRWAE